jgi:uncharacterized membrane protein
MKLMGLLGNEDSDGVRRVRLGFVEFAAVVVAITLGWWMVSQLVSAQYQAQMKANSDTASAINGLKTQVAVMNDQISTLTTQLANVPALTSQLAQVRAEVDDHERRIERIENERGTRVKGWTH